jgi:hypothetical protein
MLGKNALRPFRTSRCHCAVPVTGRESCASPGGHRGGGRGPVFDAGLAIGLIPRNLGVPASGGRRRGVCRHASLNRAGRTTPSSTERSPRMGTALLDRISGRALARRVGGTLTGSYDDLRTLVATMNARPPRNSFGLMSLLGAMERDIDTPLGLGARGPRARGPRGHGSHRPRLAAPAPRRRADDVHLQRRPLRPAAPRERVARRRDVWHPLLRLNLEHFNREKKTRERFVLVCATDGPSPACPSSSSTSPNGGSGPRAC